MKKIASIILFLLFSIILFAYAAGEPSEEELASKAESLCSRFIPFGMKSCSANEPLIFVGHQGTLDKYSASCVCTFSNGDTTTSVPRAIAFWDKQNGNWKK